MTDLEDLLNENAALELKPEIKELLMQAADALKGPDRRLFMAETVRFLGKGGQRKAERELGWDRDTIRKGTRELKSGFICVDNFGGRGRKRIEHHLPNINEDIRDIVEPRCQTDPTFRSTTMYSPVTAANVRRRLIEEKGYSDKELPCRRSISNKLNELGFKLKKVEKCRPKKKIPETNSIFKNVHRVNRIADETEGVIRISIDTKATVDIGPFSRKGKCRTGNKACDHDYEPELKLKLFGIFLPEFDETYFYFTPSNATADFMVDMIEGLWPMLKERFDPHTIVINADNGPDNSSSRTQFMKRLVDFCRSKQVSLELAYYPPYHSKYNPIERVWGVLEDHWNGDILDSVEKALGFARSMTWNGINPIVKMIEKTYEKGVKLTKQAMKEVEKKINRITGIEKWAVEIPCYSE